MRICKNLLLTLLLASMTLVSCGTDELKDLKNKAGEVADEAEKAGKNPGAQ